MRCMLCGATGKGAVEEVCAACMKKLHAEAQYRQECDGIANWLNTRVDSMGNATDGEYPKHQKRLMRYARTHGIDWTKTVHGKLFSNYLSEVLAAHGIQQKGRGRPVKETIQQAS